MRSWLRNKNKLPALILAERQLGSLLGICSRPESARASALSGYFREK